VGRKPAAEQGDTRNEIRQIAFRLFGRHGYDGVSMKTVADAAGITKAALYWHYDSKDELYVECLSVLQALYRQYVFMPMESTGNPGDRMLRVFTGMTELLADDRIREGVAGYWLETSTTDLPVAREVQQIFEREASGYIAATLREGVEIGIFDFEQPIEDLADTVISLMEAVVLPMRQHGPEQTLRLAASLAFTFFKAHATDPSFAARARAIAEAGVDLKVAPTV